MKKNTVLAAAFFVFSFFLIFYSTVSAAGISINSENGDRIAIIRDINIDGKTRGDVVALIGNIVVNGEVNGDVVALAGNIRVNGKVAGDVVCVLGNVELVKGASVYGDVVSLGKIDASPGARVSGEVVEIYGQGLKTEAGMITIFGAVTVTIFAFIVLVLGIILITISRNRYADITARIEDRMMKKLLMGFLGLLCATIVTVIFAITIITPILYIILLAVAEVFSSIYAGKIILKAFNSRGSTYLHFVTGLVTITLIKTALIFIAPWSEYIVNSILYLSFSIVVNSIGIGIMLNSKGV